MANPETVTFSEFARIAGFSRSYVTQLRKDDRLVLNAQGRILVHESRQRVKATADPAKAPVAARHAAARAENADMPESAAPPPSSERIGNTYQASRAVRERYLAMAAKRDYEVSIGKLLEASAVEAAANSAVTTLRARLENLSDILAPQLAALTDEGAVRAKIAEEIEHALDELARHFSRLDKQELDNAGND